MTYSNNEKAAIICLLIEMANVDGNVDFEELYVMNSINEELCVTKEVFDYGKAMSCDYAMIAVKHMPDEKKMHVAKLITDIIDANGDVSEKEITLLNKICKQTGLDIIINQQPE